MKPTFEYADFEKIDLRAGTILSIEPFPEAKKPAYKLKIDLGPEIGIKQSSAQITQNYTPEELIGKQVVCIVNFKPKQIGPFLSEVLTTGFDNEKGCVLTTIDKPVPNGKPLY